MKWRVGDGRAIKFFKDQWLPCVGSSRVLSPPLDHDQEMRVAELIDHELHCWRTELIDGIFLPCEAKRIKALPLSLVSTSDWIYWPMNHNGVYSLKSGYKLILELEDTETPIVTESVAKKDVWKKNLAPLCPKSNSHPSLACMLRLPPHEGEPGPT